MPGPIPFATRAYDQVAPGLPETRAINVYVTPTPAGPTKFTMAQRWGLQQLNIIGRGPHRGLFQKIGLFSSDKFVASGPTLYRETTILGTTGGTGPARFAASATQLGIVDGGRFYIYDGATLSWVQNDKTASPLPAFIGVIFIAERFVLLCPDGTFYWSDVDDGTQIDALSFATAESSPDGALEIAQMGDEFAIFGASSVEWWFITGTANAPYQRSSNRTYARGCAAQGSVVQADNTLIFMGDDKIVYRAGLQPQPISNHGIETRLSACLDLGSSTAFTVTFAGHPFYVLNIPGEGSFAYDFSTKEWAEWQSYERTLFRCAWGIMVGGSPVLGDDQSGQVWTLSATALTDGTAPLIRLATAFIPQPTGFNTLRNLTLVGSRGVGTLTDTTPQAEIRVSGNGIGDWSPWISQKLGQVGQRDLKTRWMAGFGRLESPGAWVEVRCADPVNCAFGGLIYNEGRA